MVEYYADYGIMLDTIASFIWQFNKNNEAEVMKWTGLSHEGISWIQEHCEEPDERLCIFFHMPTKKREAFLHYFIGIYGDCLLPCPFSEYLNQVLDDAVILHYLTDYYMSVSYDEASLPAIYQHVSNMDLSSTVKFHILGFYTDSHSMISLLQQQLLSRFHLIRELYARNRAELQRIQAKIDDCSLIAIDQKVHGITQVYSRMLYSVSFLSADSFVRRGLGFISDQESVLFNLGTDWEEAMQRRIDTNEIDIILLGKILSEKNRYRIIEYLLKHEEITITEAMNYLHTSLTATNYHLNMMADAHLLKVRNQGRKLFYSLNKSYLDTVLGTIRMLIDQVKIIQRKDT